MAIEDSIRRRIEQLILDGRTLSVGNRNGQVGSQEQKQRCNAWLVSAQNAIHLVCDAPTSSYRQKADRIVTQPHGLVVHDAVGEMVSTLQLLLIDADAGLLSSVADRARAETFDNFLDHADGYILAGRKNEAAVIGGVVFEDSIRRISRKLGIVEKDVQLDQIINALTARAELSGVQAKRARVAAHVRTKATHAQWDEFGLPDVTATIVFTRELIEGKLDK
jgi:hypothetical protein